MTLLASAIVVEHSLLIYTPLSQVCCPNCCLLVQNFVSLLQTCRKIAGIVKASLAIGMIHTAPTLL